jgi:hypothetical protein
MTQSIEDSYDISTGDGTNKNFDYPWDITDKTHLTVIVRNTSGNEETKTVDTDYEVSGINGSGDKEIVFTTAPASGAKVAILLNKPFTQETTLDNSSPFYLAEIEAALDENNLLITQVKRDVDRAIKASLFEPTEFGGDYDDLLGGYVSEAETYAANALASANLAGEWATKPTEVQPGWHSARTYSLNAAASAALADSWATTPEDSVVSGGFYSSLHYSRKSAASATAAANSASSAASSATEAASYVADMSADRIKGRANGAGTGTPQDLTAAQVLAILSAEIETLVASTVRAYTKQQNFAQATLTDGANIDWNLDNAQSAIVTLGGNRTLNAPTNMVAGATYRLVVKQDATGSRTLTWNAVFDFGDLGEPVLSTGANKEDIFYFDCDGTNMRATYVTGYN